MTFSEVLLSHSALMKGEAFILKSMLRNPISALGNMKAMSKKCFFIIGAYNMSSTVIETYLR